MNVLIIDDELLTGQLLEHQIKAYCPSIKSVTTLISPYEAMEVLESNTYDILFLDVEMPEMNCFDFLKSTQIPEKTSVIIVTAYSQYAIEAFNAQALHYLLKPVNPEDLIDAVNRVQKLNSATKDIPAPKTISIYNGESYSIIKKCDIIRLQADGSYTHIHLKNKSKLMTSKRIGYYADLLESPPFFRCHNSHIINIEVIVNISNGKSGFIQLEDGMEIPISHHYKPNLRHILNF